LDYWCFHDESGFLRGIQHIRESKTHNCVFTHPFGHIRSAPSERSNVTSRVWRMYTNDLFVDRQLLVFSRLISHFIIQSYSVGFNI